MNIDLIRLFPGLLLLLTLSTHPILGQVNFDADVTQGCGPLLVNFTDLTPGATGWEWDFGNGTTSTLRNPGLIYSTEGVFSVGLTVTYADGSKENFTKANYIDVTLKPQISPIVKSKVLCSGSPTIFDISFLSDSTSASQNITRLIWDFGDGTTGEGRNVTHIYENPATYSITLLAENGNGCNTVINQPDFITISPTPDAGFTFDNGFTCLAPAKINFTSNQVAGDHLWDFGDGALSPLSNPAHDYTELGSYTVKHFLTSPAGCRDTAILENGINLGQGVLSISVNNEIICAGAPVTFFSNVSNSSLYQWEFGDGVGTSNADTATYTFLTPGNYEISLTVSDATGCTSSTTRNITVTSPLTIDFLASDTSACQAPATINFQNNTTGAVSFTWDFGDGTTSILADPIHTYTEEGIYDVSLLAINPEGCRDSLTFENHITVERPEADFILSDSAGCAPLEVTFTDASLTASPVVSYLWDFGNGITSTDPNPTMTYVNEDNYDVVLIIENADGCTSVKKVLRAVQVGGTITADFVADQTSGCLGDSIQFTNNSIGDYSRCLWDFGDGNSDTTCNPTYKYSQSGNFDVTLTVTDRGCESSVVKPAYIERLLPMALFSADPPQACGSPATITFTNESVGADNWLWDFGDGTTSTEQNPTYTYNTEGIATAALEVQSAATGCYDRYEFPIEILPAKANFSVDARRGCFPFTTRFRDNSQNAVEWLWDFGDGNSSNIKNPRHTYTTPGDFDVSLVITTAGGCKDTLVIQEMVSVRGIGLDFSVSDSIGCGPFTVSFQSDILIEGELASIKWDFGDGTEISDDNAPTHTYDSAGVYNVRLSTRDEIGCVAIIQLDSMVEIRKPVAAFSTNSGDNCLSSDIQFENNSLGENLTYLWDFGDGNTSTEENPVHTYAIEDNYPISLTVIDDLGCDSVLQTESVNVGEYVIDFYADTLNASCPPLVVSFFPDSNLTNVESWFWDFGDETFSTEQFPVHIYPLPGKYDVSLIAVSESGCTDTVIKEEMIVIEGPSAEVDFGPLIGCPGDSISFAATITGDISVQWDFGDGLISDQTTINHVYAESDVYFPRLLIKNSSGCEVLVETADSVVISPVPDIDILVDESIVCEGGAISFNDNSSFQDLIETRRWDFGDGNQSNEANPIHAYASEGEFDISLALETTAGCEVSTVIPSFVKTIPATSLKIDLSDSVGCHPFTINASAIISTTEDSISTWDWDFGDQVGSSNSSQLAYTYDTPGTYQAQLSILDVNGCISIAEKTIRVLNSPEAIFEGETLRGCAPQEVQFINLSADSDSFLWNLGDSAIYVSGFEPSYTYFKDGNYDVELIAIAQNGCTDTTIKSSYIQLSHPVAAFEFSDSVVCPGEVVRFANQSIADTNLISWQWDFGDGITNELPITDHIYGSFGIYSVQLIVENVLGCRDTLLQPNIIEVLSDTVPNTIPIDAVSVSNTQAVNLDFSPYPWNDFHYYEFYRSDTNGRTLIDTVHSQNIQFYRDLGVFPEEQSYCYQIAVVNQCGVKQDVEDIPSHCAIDLTAVPFPNAVGLSWTPYSTWESVDAYRIYKVSDYNKNEATLVGEVDGSTLSFIDSSFVCAGEQSYRIEAVGITQNQTISAWSDTSLAEPFITRVEDSLDILQVSVVNDQTVEITWEWPESTEHLVEIILERNDGQGFKPIQNFNIDRETIRYEDKEVNPSSRPYAYRVVAKDLCGSIISSGRIGNTLFNKSERGTSQVRLSWNPYSEWEGGVDRYEIQIFDQQLGTFIFVDLVADSITEYIDLAPDRGPQENCYRIVAYENGGNGSASISNETCVELAAQLIIPSAFTPNNDGVNDIFKLSSQFISEYLFRVYSRWGDLVFETNDPSEGWNGYLPNGGPAQEGVYTYILLGLGYDDQVSEHTGTITLLR